MTTALQTIKNIVERIAQEVPQEAHASVMVQFAAGDWAALKAAVAEVESEVTAVETDVKDEEEETAVAKSETFIEKVEAVIDSLV